MKEKKKTKREHAIEKYFTEKKELHESLLEFIDNSDDNGDSFYELQETIRKQKILTEKDESKHFLKLISNIAKNHHRTSTFSVKIKQILNECKNSITKFFSSKEIFDIFLSNKEILLFLFDEKIITPDNKFVDEILNFQKETIPRFCLFFIPEIRPFVYEEKMIEIQNYTKYISIIIRFFQPI